MGENEFGEQLRRAMNERDVGVRELARRVPCNPGYLSNLRNGRKRPSRAIATRLDELLDAGGVLAVLASAALGNRTTFSVGRSGESTGVLVDALSAMQLAELTDHVADQWHGLVKTDNLLGPRHALGGVENHLAVLEALLRVVRAPLRPRVVSLAARYAESAAWLHEDAGDLAAARYWTGRAMEWAVEGDDRPMVAWTLFRRSQQAMASGDSAQVGGLVAAAQREARALGQAGKAAMLQQEAQACALDGDEPGCHRLLDRASALASVAGDGGDASGGHGSFCTTAYVEMQRGVCWIRLGEPSKAIVAIDAALWSLPAVYRRDRAVGLAHKACGLAAVREPTEAANIGLEAVAISRDCGSGRILRMILQLSAELECYSDLEEVSVLRAALADRGAA